MTNQCIEPKRLSFLKHLELDATRITKDVGSAEYTTKLIYRSFCPDDKIVEKKPDPYSQFIKFVSSKDITPCLILGCTGVGKSSFIEYQKKISRNKHHIIRFDLDVEHDFGLSSLSINSYFCDELLRLAKAINGGNEITQLKIIGEAINNLPSTMVKFEVDDIKLQDEKLRKNELLRLEEKLQTILPFSGVRNAILFNYELLKQFDNILDRNSRIVFIIDNIDRRDNEKYEEELVSSVILDLWEKFSNHTHNIFKLAVALRRVTFIRHIEGQNRFGRIKPVKIYITPPDPIYLIANKLLSAKRKGFGTSESKEIITIDGIQILGPKSIFIYLIYLCFFLQKVKVSPFDVCDIRKEGDLLIASTNESARDLIKTILDISVLDFSKIPGYEHDRIKKIVACSNEIFELMKNHMNFCDYLKSLYNRNSDAYREYNSDFISIVQWIIYQHPEYSKIALSQHHLVSILIRYDREEYCREREGIKCDIKKLGLSQKLTPRFINRFIFPMPFINLFSPRCSGKNGLLSRYIILKMVRTQRYDCESMLRIADEIGIKKNTTIDILNLFSQKQYVIGQDYEFIKNTKANLMLTRKGSALFNLAAMPRYINAIIDDSQVFDSLKPHVDTDIDTVVLFVEKLLKEERRIYKSVLYNHQQECYLRDISENRETGSEYPTVFNVGFFRFMYRDLLEISTQIDRFSVNNYELHLTRFLQLVKEYCGYTTDSITGGGD